MDADPPLRSQGVVSGDIIEGDKVVTQTAGGDIVGGDKITHAGTGHIFAGSGDVLIVQAPHSPANARDRANLRLLLNKVKTFWIEGVLERSVHAAFLLELGLELDIEAVDHPWASVLELPDATRRQLPPGTQVSQIFEEANRALIILGEPGSGKTVTLLELARSLIQRAEADVEGVEPIPVVFNLSSWHTQRLPLGTWMASELASKYQIPTRLGRGWLEQQRLLPLLDGLDEVAPAWQAACVAAINQYTVRRGLPGIVVCSRLEEYTRLPTRLRLNAAIRLSPLGVEQVRRYLEAGGPHLAALRQVLQADDTLAMLAQTPLFLSIMRLAYQDLPPEALTGAALNTVEARRHHLLAQYVARMLKRKGSGPRRYSDSALLAWLAWLARQMSRHSQTVYLVERMQPSWLSGRAARWVYALATRIGGWWFLGLGLSTAFVLVFLTIFGTDAAFAADVVALFVAVGPVDLIRIVLDVALRFAALGLIAGLLCGARFELSRYVRRPAGCMTPMVNLVSGSLLPSLGVLPLLWSAAARFDHPLVRTLVLALLCLPVIALSAVAFRAWDSGDNPQTDIPMTDALHWSWVQGILGAVGGFIAGALIGSACMLTLVLGSGGSNLVARLVTGALPAALVLAAGAGLTAGLRAKAIAGTSDSGGWLVRHARNVFAACLLAAMTMGFCGTLGMATYTALTLAGASFDWALIVRALGFGLACGILSGTVAALYYGGVTLIKHVVLRLLLIAQRKIPWVLSPIANQAEALVLLRRVGGGFIFIHRILLDYFAGLPVK